MNLGALYGLGAGLGQAVDNFQKQRQAQQQQQLQQLMVQNYMRQQQQQQQSDQAAGAAWPAILSGGFDGGGMGGSTAMPAPSFPGATRVNPPGGVTDMAPDPSGGYSPAPSGSGFSSGLRDLFTNLGLPAEYGDAAAGYMRKNESGDNPLAVNPTSGALGRGQWLGPRKAALTSQYGDRPSDEDQVSFIGQELQGPEARTLADLRSAAARGEPAKAAYDIWGRDFERPGAAALAKAGVGSGGGSAIPPAMQQETQRTVQQTARSIDPQVYGRMSLQSLAQQIEKANPGADPIVKMMALERAQKLLAPTEQRLWEMFKIKHDDNFKMALQDRTDARQDKTLAASDARLQARQETAGAKVFVDESGQEHWVTPGRAIPAGWHERGVGTATGKPTALEVSQEDGTVKRVEAQQLPSGQWVTADERREPIDTSRGYAVIPASQAGAAGGTRDAAQRERQLISAREVISDLQSIVQLPISTTRGFFGGRTQGPGLLDAAKENLAETLTSEDAELANSALSGLERELSIIVSPVYGGKWAAESFSKLALKEGQTANVKMFNLARMRQIADNALEAMTKSPRIGQAQKEYAADMRKMLDEAVPWTTADVLAFRDKGKDGETFRQFVERRGVGGAAKRVEQGGPAKRYASPDEVFKAIDDGSLKEEDGKRILIEQFGYKPATGPRS